jgi:hypothetical protein
MCEKAYAAGVGASGMVRLLLGQKENVSEKSWLDT